MNYNQKKELIENKLFNMDFNRLLDVIKEVNAYNNELERYSFYNNDEDFFKEYYENNVWEAVKATQYGNYNFLDDYVVINRHGTIDSYIKAEAEKIIYSDIEYISGLILSDFITEKAYNLSLYDEL